MGEVLGKCEHCHQPVLSTQEWEKPPLEKPGPELIYHTACLYYGMLTSKELGWQPTGHYDPKLSEIPAIEEGPEIIERSTRFAEELMRKKTDDGG